MIRKANGSCITRRKALLSVICLAEAIIVAGGTAACGGRDNASMPRQENSVLSEMQPQQSGDEQISVDDAKQAALADAGLSASDVTYTKEKSDYEDGIAVYDIEFFADNVEYEYEINAVTGAVYSKSVETHRTQAGHGHDGHGHDGQAGTSDTYISDADAKAAALDHAGFVETEVSRFKLELDMDDGQAVYEVEFRKDSREYEYKIDAVDGSIVEYEVD